MIDNTAERDSTAHLLGVMIEGTDNYIRGMEAAGQRQLVDSSELPADGPWPELEALGIIRRGPVDGDDLFVHASLPDGWRIKPTDHSMWSAIVDGRGVVRVEIFYKAAFYDRGAFSRVSNVGCALASADIWGEGVVELPACWAVLTEKERLDYARELQRQILDRMGREKYYKGEELVQQRERTDRVRALQALVETRKDEDR